MLLHPRCSLETRDLTSPCPDLVGEETTREGPGKTWQVKDLLAWACEGRSGLAQS